MQELIGICIYHSNQVRCTSTDFKKKRAYSTIQIQSMPHLRRNTVADAPLQ